MTKIIASEVKMSGIVTKPEADRASVLVGGTDVASTIPPSWQGRRVVATVVDQMGDQRTADALLGSEAPAGETNVLDLLARYEGKHVTLWLTVYTGEGQ